jgi:hypothetical protein
MRFRPTFLARLGAGVLRHGLLAWALIVTCSAPVMAQYPSIGRLALDAGTLAIIRWPSGAGGRA